MPNLPIICTAMVTAGSDLITVTGNDANTGLPVVLTPLNCIAPAAVFLGGAGYSVAERVSTTQLRLSRDYDGASDTDVPCEIAPFTAEMASRVVLSQQLRDYDARTQLLASSGPGLFYNCLGVTGADDPGPGKVGRNAAAWEDTTELYFDVLDAAGRDKSALIGLWDKGTVVTLTSVATRAFAAFMLAEQPSDVGPGHWLKLDDLTFVGGDDIPADGEDLVVEWNRGGAGLEFDHAVDNLAGRAAYDAAAAGTRVLVADTGAGRAAIYVKRAGAGI